MYNSSGSVGPWVVFSRAILAIFHLCLDVYQTIALDQGRGDLAAQILTLCIVKEQLLGLRASFDQTPEASEPAGECMINHRINVKHYHG